MAEQDEIKKPEEEKKPTPAAAQGQDADKGEAKIEMTSKALDERLKRATEKATADILKALGVESVEALSGVVKEYGDLKKGQMTESQKLQADLEAAKVAATKAQAERDAALATFKMGTLRTEILGAARDAKADIPQDVWMLISSGAKTPADLPAEVSGLFAEDGSIDPAKLKPLIDKVVKERPGWFKKGGVGSPSNQSGKVREPDEDDKKKAASAQAQNMYKAF